MIKVQQSGDSVTFAVRVHPRARRDGVSGVVGEALKLDLTVPAVEGKANEACIRFLSDLLKVPRSSITIAAGSKSRNKIIRISGASVEQVMQVLARASGQ
ncbi:MAG: DUF167 domain-containing protein [Acidobacteria bacterium]|nr:DUF167 domain-containing protein [Acidobacteriota bacterium]MBV9148211.1 DUF167 domain-containing protein [Acidobacteriota bacterium]MBV9437314.1 DUF167 domain-containing protein [Acidobacteriota bacterium]